MHELSAAFCSHIPIEMRASTTPSAELECELATLVTRARSEADGVDADPLAFVGYVAERVTFDARGWPQLRSLRAGELWIAFGCTTGNPDALAAFETYFAPEITNALRRSFEPALAEDAELQLRAKLILVSDGSSRLASYSGRGALGAWLRAVAVRMAIDVMRARREVPSDPSALGDAAAFDPMLASLKQRYRDEFRTAFNAAADLLTDRDRTLLRYRFVDDLSIDEIGRVYTVHRATVARWIATIREGLFEATRARLMERLGIAASELDSVLRLIDSQLDTSIAALAR